MNKLAFLDCRHAVEYVMHWKNPYIDYCILYSWQGTEFKTANKLIHPIAFPLSLTCGCTLQEGSEEKIGIKKRENKLVNYNPNETITWYNLEYCY